MFRIVCCSAALLAASVSAPAWAWGDVGHEVIAQIAEHYLEPGVRARIAAILAADRSGLTPSTGMDAEATWADKYRDSDRDTKRLRYHLTRNWHFVDLEIDGPDLSTACFGRPPPPAGKGASTGPAARGEHHALAAARVGFGDAL